MSDAHQRQTYEQEPMLSSLCQFQELKPFPTPVLDRPDWMRKTGRMKMFCGNESGVDQQRQVGKLSCVTSQASDSMLWVASTLSKQKVGSVVKTQFVRTESRAVLQLVITCHDDTRLRCCFQFTNKSRIKMFCPAELGIVKDQSQYRNLCITLFQFANYEEKHN